MDSTVGPRDDGATSGFGRPLTPSLNMIKRHLQLIALLLFLCLPPNMNAFSINNVPRSSLVADTCRDSLWKMTNYFGSMVDTCQNRFYSLSKPQTGEFLHQHCPIRDLGATWDVTTALLFWKQHQESPVHNMNVGLERLEDAILTTLKYYNTSFIPLNKETDAAAVALSPDTLLEPPTIAHSAFVILVSIGAFKLSLFKKDKVTIPPIDSLTRGILSRQRHDGAFCIQLADHDDIYRGMEFYPGEAMTALMQVYKCSSNLLHESTRQAIVPAMKRAFDFYSNYYYRQGHVDTNYHIWQVQAFARLFHVLHDENEMQQNTSMNEAIAVAEYVLAMCTDIVKSTSWKELARGRSFYPNLQTVEIACGLDAIAEGISIAMKTSRETEEIILWRNVENAVDYIKAVQDQVSPESIGFGGLGYGGIQVLEQRLDVTGHAISALTKVYQVCQKVSC